MGMNYYAYVEPESYSKYDLIESIVENNPVKIQENYVNTIANNIIHLGKKSAGWKFIWNPNYVSDYNRVIFSKYEPTKGGIEKFLTLVHIYDENGKEYSKEDFLDMAYKDEGTTTTEYYNKYPMESTYDNGKLVLISESIPKKYKKNFSIGKYEFINDGLHFSSSNEFC